ncbi:MAG: hypothetical protein M9936_24260 [Caldilinea sp.]|nr:hypothetical protein [Caldilinea sp.]MCB0067537.1 hypothetical protein [Caldilineaceae bacterium]MCB0039346.1 hypothetical protein [Caldilinea sp.]MCB0134435.1 hypothetical protein [Caldilineaceae bacterium]MCB9124187.1 hypothetical protein [Caldilineaceae bacterium]
MAGFLVNITASLICPHGGSVSIVSSNTRVRAGGAFVATMADTFTVAGCPFQIPVGAGTKPQPCVTLRWIAPAVRVRIGGQPAILQTSSAISLSVEQIPQGPPTVVATQTRVRGT